MTEVARITKHPTDRECVLLHVAPGQADRLGKFGPARLSAEHRAFVLHHSHIDALYRYARTVDIHVSDERRSGQPYEPIRIPPAECRHCGQAGSRGNPPAICPACGETWKPTAPPVREDPITKTPCPKCSHKQPGRFPFCSKCGARMAYQEPPTRPALPRPKLADPVPLAQTVETFQQAAHRGEGVTYPPYLPPVDPDTQRMIEDVPLPDPTDGNDPWVGPTPEPTAPAPEQAQAEPPPERVERQHRINSATAAIRHRPVPPRSVAVQQVTDGQETTHTPPRKMVCCGRWPNQPHTETCYMRTREATQAEPTPEPTEPEPEVEDPPTTPWSQDGWSWG